MKAKRNAFLLIGIIAIVLAIICSVADVGYYENSQFYGGDAYTGIQQAGAQTANNVMDLAIIVRFGFSAVLAIAGLICMAYALFCKPTNYTSELEEINRILLTLKQEKKAEEKPETDCTSEESFPEAPVIKTE